MEFEGRNVMSEHRTQRAIQTGAYEPPLDAGIRAYVEILVAAGIETFESCEGGTGHAYAEPTVRFHGDRTEGFRAFTIAMQNGLPVASLRRIWPVVEGEPTGPHWELVFAATRHRG